MPTPPSNGQIHLILPANFKYWGVNQAAALAGWLHG
jgi:hypothetical protein